jgi:hypothetical protein
MSLDLILLIKPFVSPTAAIRFPVVVGVKHKIATCYDDCQYQDNFRCITNDIKWPGDQLAIELTFWRGPAALQR